MVDKARGYSKPTRKPTRQKIKLIWCKLPTGEPAIVTLFLDTSGAPTKDVGEAKYIVAMDVYNRYHQFEIEDDPFEGVILQ